MKERPILFSAPMVRAILEGRKTQTRRVVKDVPAWCTDWGYTAFTPTGSISACGKYEDNVGEKFFRLKYGAPGDCLWVRERYWVDKSTGAFKWYFEPGLIDPDREADHCKLRPSIHMPRAVSRMTLEVTDVRVERLNDISAADAEAEGWPGPDAKNSIRSAYPIAWYSNLWEEINGFGSWAANPWVWVITFRKLET